jgi:hypothetical protein
MIAFVWHYPEYLSCQVLQILRTWLRLMLGAPLGTVVFGCIVLS